MKPEAESQLFSEARLGLGALCGLSSGQGAGDFPGGPVGKVYALPLLGTWVPSLAARSHMFCCSGKKKKKDRGV